MFTLFDVRIKIFPDVRKNWPETIRKDLRGLGLTWEDALDATEGRDGCAALHEKD